MSADGRLAPGVEHGDEYTDADLVCTCDHGPEEHMETGECEACDCHVYDPMRDEDRAEQAADLALDGLRGT